MLGNNYVGSVAVNLPVPVHPNLESLKSDGEDIWSLMNCEAFPCFDIVITPERIR